MKAEYFGSFKLLFFVMFLWLLWQFIAKVVLAYHLNFYLNYVFFKSVAFICKIHNNIHYIACR